MNYRLLAVSNASFSFILDMELFKTDILNKESKDFVRNTLPSVIECNYCNIDCCKWDSRFHSDCELCKKKRCSNCKCFNLAVTFLLQNVDADRKMYLHNLIIDYLNMSSESLKRYKIVTGTHEPKKRVHFDSSCLKNEQKIKSNEQRAESSSSKENVKGKRKVSFQMKNSKRKVYFQ